MPKYYLLLEAKLDLENIWEYTYFQWSVAQADKYHKALLNACRELAEKTVSGKNYDKIRRDLLGYRVNKHIIFYKIISDDEIEVVRILHGQMDLENRMDEL